MSKLGRLRKGAKPVIRRTVQIVNRRLRSSAPQWPDRLCPNTRRPTASAVRVHVSEFNTCYILAFVNGWRRDSMPEAEAEPLYRRALDIDERLLVPEHRDVGGRPHQSGRALSGYRQSGGSDPTLRAGAGDIRKGFWPEHPYVLMTLDHLGQMYRYHGDNAEAADIYKKPLDLREKTLGRDHADVATTAGNKSGLIKRHRKRAIVEFSKPVDTSALGFLERIWTRAYASAASPYTRAHAARFCFPRTQHCSTRSRSHGEHFRACNGCHRRRCARNRGGSSQHRHSFLSNRSN